jgi:ribosome-associated protein
MPNTSESEKRAQALLGSIERALLDKQGYEILELDVRGICSYTDFFIVCHAESDTQVKALANSCIVTTGEELDEKPWKKEGLNVRRWVTLDYVNVVVHIFNKETREYYNLEKMWSDAKIKEVTDELFA